MPHPILYEFPHSHFCEVARWALDFKQIEYRSVPVLPGYHLRKIKKMAPKSSVPVLQINGEIIQEAQAIVEYLDTNYPKNPLTPTSSGCDIRKFENDIANDIAVPLRRYCYAHLVDRPDLVRFFFMHRSSWFENQAFKLTYPMLKSRLVAGYDCTPSGARRAQSELSQAMDKYDGLLGANDYFLGESFSRIDLTFASLAVFMLMPMEYPVPWPEEMFQHKTFEWFSRFHDRPCLKHVARMYAEHRKR